MPKPLFRRPHKLPMHGARAAYLNQVDSSMTPNLDKVRADMQKLSLAVLPQDEIRLLFEQPQAYFQARAEAAANPFAAPSPLSLEQDWLGFGRLLPTRPIRKAVYSGT